MVEFSPNDLEAVLDRNERNASNSIVATAEDGTLLQIIGVEPGAAIHTAFTANVEARVQGAVQLDATVWSWLFDEPLDGLHSRDVFMPDGSHIAINGYDSPNSASLDEYSLSERPELTDLEVWKAVFGKPAERGSYVQWFTALLAAQNEPPPTWLERNPFNRQIDPDGDTPPSVVDSLDTGFFVVNATGTWPDVGVICQFANIAWGECYSLYGAGTYQSNAGYLVPGQGFSIRAYARGWGGESSIILAEFTPEIAVVWSAPWEDGDPIPVIVITIDANAPTLEALATALDAGDVRVTIEVVPLSELGEPIPGL